MLKKKVLVILALALVLILAAVPTLANSWKYYIEITIQDTSGTDRTGVPVLVDISGDNLHSAGYINADGTDTRLMEGATERSYGLAGNKTVFLVPTLVANQQRSYKLYTGYSPVVDNFDIITGTGYVTIADADALELGGSFEIELEGYIDTSGVNKNLVYKPGAFSISTNPWWIGVMRPNGVGTYTEFEDLTGASTHWEAVDEVTPDDDTTHVGSDVDDSRDTFALSDVDVPDGYAIQKIVVYEWVRWEGDGDDDFYIMVRSGATDTLSNTIAVDGNWVYESQEWTQDPNTSAPWTESGVNSIEAGAKVDRGIDVSQVYVEVWASTSTGESIRASILAVTGTSWKSPTGHVDPESDWSDETNAYDEDTGTYATCASIPADNWGEFLELDCGVQVCDTLRFYADYNNGTISSLDLDAYYNDTWNGVCSGAFDDFVWVEEPLGDVYNVSKVRIRLYNTNTSPRDGKLYEFDFNFPEVEDLSVTATGISSGEYTIKVVGNYPQWIGIMRPSGAGTYTEFEGLVGAATHWEAVDEVIPDSATSYVGTDVNTARDTFALTDIDVPDGYTIQKVIVYEWVQREGIGDDDFYVMIRSGTTDSSSTYVTGLTDTWVYKSEEWTQDPNTSATWTESGVNAMEAGATIGSGVNVSQVYVEVWASLGASTFKIYVDDMVTPKDSIALSQQVLDNSIAWVMIKDNTVPCMNYYKHTVDGTLIAWYQPVAMISGTTLPDREGAAQNGTITWGSNSDLTVTIGGITGFASSIPAAGEDGELSDMITPAEQPEGWYGTGANIANLPFYEQFSEAAQGMGMTTRTLYVFAALGIASAIGLSVLLFTGSTLISAAAAGGTIAIGAGTTILGKWMIFVFAILAVGIIYLARQH